MIKPFFIGFAGKKQTGKDSSGLFTKEILAAADKTCECTHFGDELKEHCHLLFDIPRELLWGSDSDKNQLTKVQWDSFSWEIRYRYGGTIEHGIKKHRYGPMTIREVLQVYGTDVVRAINQDAWSNLPFKKKWTSDVVTVNDLRYPNEVENILKAGGVVLRLQRDTGLTDTHISETALDNYVFDNVYDNNGSLEDLKSYLEQFIKENVK